MMQIEKKGESRDWIFTNPCGITVLVLIKEVVFLGA